MEEMFFKTVTNGRPAKGMPPWKDVFSRGTIRFDIRVSENSAEGLERQGKLPRVYAAETRQHVGRRPLAMTVR